MKSQTYASRIHVANVILDLSDHLPEDSPVVSRKKSNQERATDGVLQMMNLRAGQGAGPCFCLMLGQSFWKIPRDVLAEVMGSRKRNVDQDQAG